MPRCPSCNKFAALDTSEDPEVSLEIDEEGTISGDVRIANKCEEDGEELAEANFSIELGEQPTEIAEHLEIALPGGEKHHLSIKEVSANRTDRSKGKGRGTKTFYGAEVTFEVTCTCDTSFTYEGAWSDDIQASHMDSLV